jgi:hypothetical protein
MSVLAWTNRQLRRSPLKRPPFRLPGQSGEERIHKLREAFFEDVTVTMCLVAMALMQWMQWWLELPPRPIPVTVLALTAILYVWKKGVPLKRVIGNLKLGRDGERVVGQILEQLRGKGYEVFHDISGPDFNIDHAIVGPAGVFTIETKTRTKLIGGSSTIVYDGNAIRFENGGSFKRPLKQARAQALWLADLLNATKANFTVRPVVVFPEWYVERIGNRSKDDVWVLNPKALEKFLDHEPAVLSSGLIDVASNILAAYCRQAVVQEE